MKADPSVHEAIDREPLLMWAEWLLVGHDIARAVRG